mgnify:FL=1
MYTVRDAKPQDLVWISDHMRASDAAEIAATSGVSPASAMAIGKAYSPYLKVACLGEIPVLVFGVCPTGNPMVGKVWMLATNILQNPRARKLLARYSRNWVEDMQSIYPVLTNITDARNTIHHKWLKWCGFRFIQKLEHGPVGAAFFEFVRIRNHV